LGWHDTDVMLKQHEQNVFSNMLPFVRAAGPRFNFYDEFYEKCRSMIML
jgi:hypothetical protein